MELQDFISDTLLAIIAGVKAPQDKAAAHGALVNPGGLMRTTTAISNDAIWDNRNNNYARQVSFDIAVTVEGSTQTNAKIGVLAGIANLGAGGQSNNKEMAVSRLQFSIPVLFPTADAHESARRGKHAQMSEKDLRQQLGPDNTIEE